MKRTLAIVLGGILSLGGAFLIGNAFLSTPAPVKWLDAHTQKVDDGTYRANQTPLEVADDLAAAAKPRSRYVDASGIALRYRDLTVTATAGKEPSTSVIYVDRKNSRRRYYYGAWAAGRFSRVQGFTSAPGDPTDPAATTSTRRGEDFRGGGPGGGK